MFFLLQKSLSSFILFNLLLKSLNLSFMILFFNISFTFSFAFLSCSLTYAHTVTFLKCLFLFLPLPLYCPLPATLGWRGKARINYLCLQPGVFWPAKNVIQPQLFLNSAGVLPVRVDRFLAWLQNIFHFK